MTDHHEQDKQETQGKPKRRRGRISWFSFLFSAGVVCASLPMLIGWWGVYRADTAADRAAQEFRQYTPPPPPPCERDPGFYTDPPALVVASGQISGRDQVLVYRRGEPVTIRFDGGSFERSLFCHPVDRAFSLSYPAGWRIITGEDEPPARLLLVPPDPDSADDTPTVSPACALIRIGDQRRAPLPTLPGCDPAALRQITRIVSGVPFTLLAPRDSWDTYLPAFEQVVTSAAIRFITATPHPSPTPAFILTPTPSPA